MIPHRLMKPPVLLVAAALVLGGYFVLATPKDPLADVASGVRTSLTVSTTLIDSLGVTQAANVKYGPPSPSQRMSLVANTLTVAGTFPPLAGTDPGGPQCSSPLTITSIGDNPLKIGTTNIAFRATQNGHPASPDGDLWMKPAGGQWAKLITIPGSPPYDWSTHITAHAGDQVFVVFSYGTCYANSPTLSTDSSNTGGGGGSPGGGNPPPSGTMNIAYTVKGTVETKNLAQDVTLTVEFRLWTARTLRNFAAPLMKTTTVTVGRAGGDITPTGVTFDQIPTGDLNGDNSMTVWVTATSQDLAGNSLTDKANLTGTFAVDATGSVHINIQPASITNQAVDHEGKLITRTRTETATLV